MPTVGWILEDDLDRFLSATLTTPDPGPAPPPRHHCPFCHHSFEKAENLRKHLSANHRASRPYLLIDGQEPSQQDVLRLKLKPESIQLFNVTHVGVSTIGDTDFRAIAAHEISKLITDTSAGRIWLRLENHFDKNATEIVQHYDLSFRIYSQEQLASVDDLFVRLLARLDPSIALIDDYLQQSETCGAPEYSSALGDYVLAVLNKDNDPASGVRSGRQDYRRKLNSSLRTLKDFDRPLARLVSALARFSSNDFSNCYQTGVENLDLANRQLLPATRYTQAANSIRAPSSAESGIRKISIVPIDNGSDSVMRWADRLANIARWTKGLEDSLVAETSAHTCDPLDRAKIHVLWARAAHRLGKSDAAKEPLRALVGNDCFGTWAEPLFTEIL